MRCFLQSLGTPRDLQKKYWYQRGRTILKKFFSRKGEFSEENGENRNNLNDRG